MRRSIIYIPQGWHEWSLALQVIFYSAAGLNHFRMPGFYYPLVPDYLPNPMLINAASGGAELLLAVLLALPATRRIGAMGILVMLIAFIPSHVWFIQQGGCLDPQGLCVPLWVAWLRLLVVHPLLLAWAGWHFRRPG